jgi:hypothetical protein
MIDNEPNDEARRIPMDLDDGVGGEYTGTAPTGGEVLVSICGAAWQAAAGTCVKLEDGDFYYEATRAECTGRGMRLVRVAKTGMGTAIFEWFVGDRQKNEPDPLARRVPIMLELAGVPVTGATLAGAEVELSTLGGALTSGTGTAGEIGFGAYYYEPTLAEYGFRGPGLLSVNDAAADEYKYEFVVEQENSPAPTSTSEGEIRDRIADIIAGLTPTSLSSDRFREHRNEQSNFIDYCETKPNGALRRFQVIETGADSPPETSSVYVEERLATFVITIAYPRTARYGADQALDRHDVMREDQRIIERAIGPAGRANFTDPWPNALWRGGGVTREEGEGCDYLVISQDMAFVVTYAVG